MCWHCSYTKRGGVSIYYKDHLTIRKRKNLCQFHECLVTELKIGKTGMLLYMLTYILESSSCIDFIFTSNPMFISASWVELLLYGKCHHNLIYRKTNFNVLLLPPYTREVWDYKNAKVEDVQQFLVLTGILFSKENY